MVFEKTSPCEGRGTACGGGVVAKELNRHNVSKKANDTKT